MAMRRIGRYGWSRRLAGSVDLFWCDWGQDSLNELKDELWHLSQEKLLAEGLAVVKEGGVVNFGTGSDADRKRAARVPMPFQRNVTVRFSADCGDRLVCWQIL